MSESKIKKCVFVHNKFLFETRKKSYCGLCWLTDEMLRAEGSVQVLHSDGEFPILHLTSSPSGSNANRLKSLRQFEGTLRKRKKSDILAFETNV